ncbi:hypothetical protein ACFE04_009270 [Oxalis oulophora]
MYAETTTTTSGIFFPNFGHEYDVQQLEDYCKSQYPLSLMCRISFKFLHHIVSWCMVHDCAKLINNLLLKLSQLRIETVKHSVQQGLSAAKFDNTTLAEAKTRRGSNVTEYDLGGEGDLFKAPEPIIEEPVLGIDPMTTAQGLKVADIELVRTNKLFNDALYECEKDLMETSAMEATLSDIYDIKIPLMRMENIQTEEHMPLPDLQIQKSESTGCLRNSFPEIPATDFGSIYGMRRAFSEGDIKTLAYGNINLIHSPLESPLFIGNIISEDRLEKLSRYRHKKTKRNFGRKIKYACRKTLADSQPRIRGRFAKTED